MSLTGQVAGIDVSTVGTGGLINLNGTVNLTGVTYSGTNADLLQLKNEATLGGGIVALTFQFVPAKTLNQFAAAGADSKTSYSGTITTARCPSPPAWCSPAWVVSSPWAASSVGGTGPAAEP